MALGEFLTSKALIYPSVNEDNSAIDFLVLFQGCSGTVHVGPLTVSSDRRTQLRLTEFPLNAP